MMLSVPTLHCEVSTVGKLYVHEKVPFTCSLGEVCGVPGVKVRGRYLSSESNCASHTRLVVAPAWCRVREHGAGLGTRQRRGGSKDVVGEWLESTDRDGLDVVGTNLLPFRSAEPGVLTSGGSILALVGTLKCKRSRGRLGDSDDDTVVETR